MKLITSLVILLFFMFQNVSARFRMIGVVSPNNESKIVGFFFNKYGTFSCSGGLIHPEWLLTSATCARRVYDEEIRVKVGGKVDKDFNTGYHIKNTIIHPGFSPSSLKNDIALVKLVHPVPSYGRTLKISQSENLVGKKAIILGYGNTDQYFADGTLREHKTSILNNKICSLYPVLVGEDRMCSYENRACAGDEGSPLVSEDRNELYGLVSITEDQAFMCGGDKILPITTYIKVENYADWVRNVTNVNYL